MRHKNGNWDLADGKNITLTWEQVEVAVLMDVRDELQRLNAAIYCPNFQDIPRRLNRIVRNTTKRRRKAAK